MCVCHSYESRGWDGNVIGVDEDERGDGGGGDGDGGGRGGGGGRSSGLCVNTVIICDITLEQICRRCCVE